MRKLAEKVALIAQICITLVFAITTLINLTTIINPDGGYENGNAAAPTVWQENSVLTSLMLVLFIAYLGLSAYMIYANFAERENLKRVLLFCDSESATRTNVKVVNKIINGCAKQAEGITVKKIRVREGTNKGFNLNLKVHVNADNVSQTIDTFRCLLTDCFDSILGLKFTEINFEVAKLNTRYAPNVVKAEQQADKLGGQREVVDEIYNEPIDNNVALPADTNDAEQKGDVQ